eukprot:3195022-Heterocapsa_arctica.AAC.1
MIVRHGAIRACLACSFVETGRSARTGFGIACPESGALSHLIMSFLLGRVFDEDLRQGIPALRNLAALRGWTAAGAS